MAAFQNWYNTAANTAPVSNTVPPALIPPQGSVLNTQPVPSSYTMNRPTGGNANVRGAGRSPKNTPVSTVSQINQILGLNMGAINTPLFPNNRMPVYGAGGGTGGGEGVGSGASGLANSGMANAHSIQAPSSNFANPASGDWDAVQALDDFQQWATSAGFTLSSN